MFFLNLETRNPYFFWGGGLAKAKFKAKKDIVKNVNLLMCGNVMCVYIFKINFLSAIMSQGPQSWLTEI